MGFRRGIGLVVLALAFAWYEKADLFKELLPLGSGLDLKKDRRQDAGRSVLTLRGDKGGLECRVQLFFRIPTGRTASFAAAIEGETSLATSQTALVPDTVRLEILPSATAPDRHYFQWPSGRGLNVSHEGPPLELVTWTVWHKKEDKESDTQGKAATRFGLNCIVAVLTVFAFLHTLIAALKDNATSRAVGSPERALAEHLIETIIGDTPEETEHLRGFLRGVLIQKLSPDEALNQLGLLAFAKRWSIRAKAPARMIYRIPGTEATIAQWKAILQGCLPP